MTFHGSEPLSLSFCTTCMGRREHLAITLANNLVVAREFAEQTEIVVLDYGSCDGLGEWLIDSFASELRSGQLRYWRTDAPSVFHHSHAKNVAHRLARGSLLFNLDADNFIGVAMIARIREIFTNRPESIAWVGAVPSVGGRICIRRSDFQRLGGYDERLHGWGGEDVNLVRRATRGLGLQLEGIAGYGSAIKHGDEERTENVRDVEIDVTDSVLARFSPKQRGFARMLRGRDPKLLASWVANVPRRNETEHDGTIRVHEAGCFGQCRLVDHEGNALTL